MQRRLLNTARTARLGDRGRLRQVRKMTTATTSNRDRSAFLAPFTSTSDESVKIPKLLYGTAWKKERTSTLVYQALEAGFRGVDTAAQPRHYQEDLVGEGIRRAIQDGILTRKELYIQTKFTPPSGQDPKNMPYNASQSIPEQIHSSIASSLSHLTISTSEDPYIDCLLLHSPLRTLEETALAWKTLESYVPAKIRTLGISNVPLSTLESLYQESTIKPSVVQNRFYPDTRWDVPLRQFCRENGIRFESFWTLTGNPQLMGRAVVERLARELENLGISDPRPVALYALVLGLEGVSILNGTTKQERMRNDLTNLEVVGQLIEGKWKGDWESWVGEFRGLIGDT